MLNNPRPGGHGHEIRSEVRKDKKSGLPFASRKSTYKCILFIECVRNMILTNTQDDWIDENW